jgi:hypothetical protein
MRQLLTCREKVDVVIALSHGGVEKGEAWNFFTHDHARSRACRWGEDGIAGISGDKRRLCFALALWNGKDSILKERLFGLTKHQADQGTGRRERSRGGSSAAG